MSRSPSFSTRRSCRSRCPRLPPSSSSRRRSSRSHLPALEARAPREPEALSRCPEGDSPAADTRGSGDFILFSGASRPADEWPGVEPLKAVADSHARHRTSRTWTRTTNVEVLAKALVYARTGASEVPRRCHRQPAGRHRHRSRWQRAGPRARGRRVCIAADFIGLRRPTRSSIPAPSGPGCAHCSRSRLRVVPWRVRTRTARTTGARMPAPAAPRRRLPRGWRRAGANAPGLPWLARRTLGLCRLQFGDSRGNPINRHRSGSTRRWRGSPAKRRRRVARGDAPCRRIRVAAPCGDYPHGALEGAAADRRDPPVGRATRPTAGAAPHCFARRSRSSSARPAPSGDNVWHLPCSTPATGPLPPEWCRLHPARTSAGRLALRQ